MVVVMDSGVGNSIDRISNLPDSVLLHVLSFLPTKYSVGTSVLSKRWENLWASVPNLDFDDNLIFHEWSTLSEERRAEIDLDFMNFVDRVLLLSDISCFQKLHLSVQFCSNYDLIHTWICSAIKRKIKELRFYYSLDTFTEDVHFCLPCMVFTSKTLVVLELYSRILVEVPNSVWLPSLKILSLREVKFENEDSLPKLLSGCPILEKLDISRWTSDTQQVLNVSAPTVKYLRVLCLVEHYGESTVETIPGSKLVVNGPHIQELTIQDYVSEDFILTNLSSLSKATIEVGCIHENHIRGNSYGSNVCKLLNGIAHVKSLLLHQVTLSFLSNYSNYVLPTFHNLNSLEVNPAGDPGWNLLVDLLECSPNLAILDLEKYYLQVNSERGWNSPQRALNCLSHHLKEIRIQELCGLKYEIDGVKYLLENARALDKMTIGCQNLKAEEGFHVRNALSKLARGSKSCQLNLIF